MNTKMFIDEINAIDFLNLCKLLNVDNSWRTLGGELNYSVLDIETFGRESNPAKCLLLDFNRRGDKLQILINKLVSCNLIAAADLLKSGDDFKNSAKINNPCHPATVLEKNNSSTSNNQAQVTKNLKIPPPSYQTTENGTNNLHKTDSSLENRVKDRKDIPTPPPSYRTTLSNNISIYNDIKQNDKTKEFEEFFKESIDLNLITYDSLIASTYGSSDHNSKNCNPKNLIGEGGFGVVYKGRLQDSDCAIKVLNKIKPEFGSNFKLEINSLSKYSHENIIKMIGCSIDGPYNCIVYEFMSNGSLRDRLDCINNSVLLNWYQRHKIILDVASALKYLHTTFEQPLIHGDVKSTNILIDKSMRAKLSDFGLARDATRNNTNNEYTSVTCPSSCAYATKAYMPFEFFQTFRLTLTTDIHCFGIVILESITGQKPYDENFNLLKTKFNKSQSKLANEWKDPLCNDWPKEHCQNLLDIVIECISEKESRPNAQNLYEKIKWIDVDIETQSFKDESYIASENHESSLSDEDDIYGPRSNCNGMVNFNEMIYAINNLTLNNSNENSDHNFQENRNVDKDQSNNENEEFETCIKNISQKSLN